MQQTGNPATMISIAKPAVSDLLRMPVHLVFADGMAIPIMATITNRSYGWDGALSVDEIKCDPYRASAEVTAVAIRCPGGRHAQFVSGPTRLRAGDTLVAQGRIRLDWSPMDARQPDVTTQPTTAPRAGILERMASAIAAIATRTRAR